MKKITFSDLKFITLFAMLFAVVGIQNIFLATFTTESLDSTFWSRSGQSALAYYLTIILVVFMVVEKRKKKDENITQPIQVIKDFVIEDLESSFYEFNDMENLREKKDEWKKHINHKITKLEKKAKPLDRLAWKKDDESNAYVAKKKYLISMLEDDYIDENIYFLDVKYEHVDESTITNGYTSKRNKKYTQENALWKITKDTAPKFILSTLWSIMAYGFALEFKEPDIVFIYRLIITLFNMLLSIIWAINYAPDFIEEQIIAKLNNRIIHIKKYIEWKNNRKQVSTDEYR